MITTENEAKKTNVVCEPAESLHIGIKFAPHLEIRFAGPLHDGCLEARHNFWRLEDVEVGRPDGALSELVPGLAVVVAGRVEAHGVEGVLPADGEDLLGSPGIK